MSIKSFLYLVSIFSWIGSYAVEENFLLIDGRSKRTLQELGSHVDERLSPCSTFKIALSLMGFDAGILKNPQDPVWLFQEGYDDFLDAWRHPQTPYSWMKQSCVWYSQVLAQQLGFESVHSSLAALHYGNQDFSGGLTVAWLSSSLKISPREQVDFIAKMLDETLPVSVEAMQRTRELLFVEDLPNGWRLFGKTGWSGSAKAPDEELGWVVGWIEKEHLVFPFAYTIRDIEIDRSKRLPRVKQLLEDALPMWQTRGPKS